MKPQATSNDAAPVIGRAWPEYLSPSSLEKTVRLILQPERYRERVIETAVIQDELIVRTVRIELSSGSGPHLVPIASPPRGDLVDIIRVEATPSVSGMVLGRREYAVVARRLLLAAANKIDGLDLHDEQVKLALTVATAPADLTQNLASILDSIRRAHLATWPQTKLGQLRLLADDNAFMRLFRYFRGFRPILVPCDPAVRTFSLAFETDIGLGAAESSTFGQVVRNLTGLTAYDFGFPIQNAPRAQTHHFRFRVPPGQYLRACRVEQSHILRPRRPASIPKWDRKPYVPTQPAILQFTPADHDGIAHVYLSNVALDAERLRALTVRIQISERPLGQLFATLLRWFIVLVVLLIVDALGTRIVVTQSAIGATLLLGLPGLLGLSSLIVAPSEPSRSKPVGPQVASFIAGLVSLGGAATFGRWTLDYGRCSALRSDKIADFAQSKKNLPVAMCPTSAPPDVLAALNTLEALAFLGVVIYSTLLAVSLCRYLAAGRKRPITVSKPAVLQKGV